MPRMAFGIKGVGQEAGFNDEPVKPGSYKGVLKNLRISYIKKEGPNKGKPRLNVGVQVESGVDPKAKGRMFWAGFNIIEGQEGWVNGFLNAVTDGSPAAKKAIQEAFWGEGPEIPNSDDGHITKIGRYRIDSPNGEIPISFTLKTGKNEDGSKKSEVGRFLVKKSADSDDGDDDDDGDSEPVSVAASSSDGDDEPPF